MYVVSLGLQLYLNLLSYFRSNVCGVVSLGLQLYLHLLSYFRSNVCGISGPPALLTSIVIFPFQCMWYLWASSFTYIYCHISVPMYVVSLGLQLYLHLLSYFRSNVCGISGPPALLTSTVIFPFQCMHYQPLLTRGSCHKMAVFNTLSVYQKILFQHQTLSCTSSVCM